jgi:hypothetical protein
LKSKISDFKKIVFLRYSAFFETFRLCYNFWSNGDTEVKQLSNMFIFVYSTTLVQTKKLWLKIQARHFELKFLSPIFRKKRIFEIFARIRFVVANNVLVDVHQVLKWWNEKNWKTWKFENCRSTKKVTFCASALETWVRSLN